MGSAFTPTETYERTIGDSPAAHSYLEGVDPFTIELRPLDAGDRAKIRDALAMEREDGAGGFALGTVELLHVKAAIVSWTLGPIVGNVERLRPEVLEAIREHVSYGSVPVTPPTKAELDAAPEKPPASAEAQEAAGRHLRALEDDELREEEAPGSVPLQSS